MIMNKPTRSIVASASLVGALSLVFPAGVASAASPQAQVSSTRHTVMIQTNSLTGNRIAVYDQAPDGTLTRAGSYSTGGLGGQASNSVADYLASQGSLVYNARQHTLLAVNAGSNTLSVFKVRGDRLTRRQVLPSGGRFPVSIAVNGDLVYALNGGGAGTVAGFRLNHGRLRHIHGSVRHLELANTTPPNFLTSPGQIGFTPDGRNLLVTTKAATNSIEAFRVTPRGLLSEHLASTAASTPVPFAFTFTPNGHLVVAQAGNSTLGTYAVHPDTRLTPIGSLSDGQQGLCWVTRIQNHYYVANAGSNTISAYTVSPRGIPALLGSTGVVATTDAGPIDMAASPDGQTLYAQAGAAGRIDTYRVNRDGTLTRIGSISGLPTGIEGIAVH
jgi:6-phosphogluconolactonase (cycloisomerase 2 family)